MCAISIITSATCFAQESYFPESELQECKQSVSNQSTYYSAIRAELEPISVKDWTIEQHHKYLDASLWTIQCGLTLYFMENGNLPADLDGLAGTSYIPMWPGNPYDQWNPIRVLSLADGFSLGDATLQVCPYEFWSYVKNPRPVSCELSIFGPDIEYGQLGDAQPMKANTWVVVPEGAVFMLGQHAEPASVTRQKSEQ
jgi:hypothetical protein